MQESAPCRTVQMTLDVLNLKYETVHMDLRLGEGRTPDFLEINPQHNLPVLVDKDLVLNESRAICAYLVTQYGRDDSLYPKDVKLRARVDQRLYFDMGVFYSNVVETYLPVVVFGAKESPKSATDKYQEILGWVTSMVRGGFVAGTPQMTIADISMVSTYSTLKELGVIDTRTYPFLEAWFQRCKQQIPHYNKTNAEGAEAMGLWYKRTKVANAH